jgi:TusA-related sulfurtransferase
MARDNEIKINARGLSNPGPRMMVETALAKRSISSLRVVVSSKESVDELMAYFETLQAEVVVDHIGNDYHLLVNLPSASPEK